MARRSDKRPGYARLLDAWTPPSDAGQPVGCIATTFTFQPELFEEECLSRFLRMESDPREDGIAYVLEREERMAQLQCAAALVDQHHCAGARSLRWDMLCIRPARGILHAKISLLVWTEVVRLIVGSANLTEDGYRRNREVFGVLDWREAGGPPVACLTDLLDYLERIVALSRTGVGGDGPAARCLALLGYTRRLAANRQDEIAARRRPVLVAPVLVEPGSQDALAQLAGLLPSRRPADVARVCSPFFDPPGAPNAPAQALWRTLRLRGEARVEFRVDAQEDGATGAFMVQAPESLLSAQPPGRPVSAAVVRAVDAPSPDGAPDALRPLHAKAIWLGNDEAAVCMVGSSNFTSPGLGLSGSPNLEANLAYAVDRARHPKAYDGLQVSFPPGEPFPAGAELRWQRESQDEDSLGDGDLLPLPLAFGVAIYECDGPRRHAVRFVLDDAPPLGFVVTTESDDAAMLSADGLGDAGAPCEVRREWPSPRPPTGFWVTWQGAAGRAWWPVNVASSDCLPPPAELDGLPLDVLIDILTSARPMYKVLAAHLARKQGPAGPDAVAVDPHKRVDTSRFLLQRTRRMSWALTALRERLERPAATRECLDWRLRGPVGVAAVAEALQREAHSEDERRFLLAELMLELSRVAPAEAPNCLSAGEVRHATDALLTELAHDLRSATDTRTPIGRYVAEVLEAIGA